MKQQITKMLLLLFIVTLTCANSFGQCVSSAISGTATSGNARCPMPNFRFERGHYVITAAEMAAAGIGNGTVISAISWKYSSAPSITNTGSLAVYFENTLDNSDLKSTTWATAIVGMTNSRTSSSYTLPNNVNTFSVPMTSNFTYTGNSIYVAYEWSFPVGTLATLCVVQCNSAMPAPGLASQQSNVALPTTLVVSNSLGFSFRPQTSFTAVNPANDAGVSLLYTMGTLALGYSTNHIIQAQIVNIGNNALTNYPVSLNISGANTFSDVQLVTIPSCSSAVVTFAPFTPIAIGSNTVAVTVAPDDNSANNSKSIVQTITSANVAFKYPGEPQAGVGFNPPAFGDFVAKFKYAGAYGDQDTIENVYTDFVGTLGLDYQIVIFSADGVGGAPGTLLYQSPTLQTAGIGSAAPVPNIIVTQDYCVGIRQLSTALANVAFAFQNESPIRTGAFYFTVSSIPPWITFEPNNSFRLSIEVKMYQALPPSCTISNSPANGGSVCTLTPTLSWANGGGTPTGYKISLGTIAPNYNDMFLDFPVGLATSFVTPTLTQGVTYGWTVTPFNGIGDAGCSPKTFTVQASPNGNTQATAIVLSLPATVAGNNFSTNCFTDDYTTSFTNGQASPDVFYKIHTGNCTDALTISLCAGSSAQDTYIHLLDEFGNEVVSDDDGCNGGTGFTSLITLQAVNPDKDYYIVVEGFATTLVTYSMSVTEFDNSPQASVPVVTTVGPICESGSLALSAGTTPAGTYNYVWTTPDGFNPGNVSSFTRSSITTAMSGTYSVVATSTAGCISNGNVSVTVNDRPTAVPTADPAFCSGTASLHLFNNAAGAATLTYAWTRIGGGYSSSDPDPVIPTTPDITIPNPHSGTYQVVVTDGNGCVRTATTLATVYPIPDVTITPSGGTNICTGQSYPTLQADGAGLTGTYSWNTLETASLIVTTVFGNYSVTGTDANTCQNSANINISESLPPAQPTITPPGATVLCTDGFTTTSVTLHCNQATNILWSDNETTQDIVVDYVDNAISVTYTDNAGCYSVSNYASTTVDMYSTAPTSATSNAPFNNICLGSNVTLNMVGGTLGDNAQWKWYEGGCGTGGVVATGANPVITPATAGSHTYYVRSESVSCGNTGCASVTIIVSPNTALATVHYTASANVGCNGSFATFSVNAVSGAQFYNWSGTAGALFNGVPGPVQTAGPSVVVTFATPPPGGASGYSICCFAGNACRSSNTICAWVRAKVSQPGAIIGSVTGCPSTNPVYSVVAVTGADSYTWSITGAAGINGGGATLTTPFNSITLNLGPAWTSGTLSVYASLNCGYSSAIRTKSISNTPPQPGTITGPTSVCAAVNPNNYSVTAVSGAASYVWTCSVLGALLTPSSNTCSIVFPAVIPGGSTVCVQAVSSCGNPSPVRCKGITSGVPGTPGNITGAGVGVCNTIGVYSYGLTTLSAGATSYVWNITGGASVEAPNNLSGVTIDFPNNFTSGVITVNGHNACGDGGVRTLSVIGAPALPGVFTAGNALPCSTIVETYTTAGSAGATSYNWTVPVTSTIVSTPPYSNSILVQIGNVSGNITVAAVNDCGTSAARSFAITVGCRLSQVMSSSDNAVSVYPNPTNDKITLSFFAYANENVEMSIADLLGRTVMSERISAIEGDNQHEADLSSLSKGVYLIHLNGANINEVVKVTVE